MGFNAMRWYMFADYDQDSQKAVRIPVVASYAYELVNQLFPLRGLPLRVHTENLGGSGDLPDSARYQINRAYLTFHDMKVVAEVRSWEPKPSEPNKARKTLQSLRIELKEKQSFFDFTPEAHLAGACFSEGVVSFHPEVLIMHGPEIIIER